VVSESSVVPPGVMPALITPVGPDGGPDLDAVGRLVRHAVAGGVEGLAPCGSTGEGWRLDGEARRRVVERVVAEADGLPVIAGVPVSTRTATLAEIEAHAAAGVRAALVAPPPGLALSTAEIGEMYASLAASSALPLVIYHIPSVTHAPITPGLVGELCDEQAIVGVKDSSRDMETMQALVAATAHQPGFTLLTGVDTLLVASLLAGAHGTIAASPGLFPALAVATMQALRGGRVAEALEYQQRVVDVVRACRALPFPSGWKAAAAVLGLARADGVWPGGVADREAVESLRGALSRLGVLSVDGAA